MLELQPGIEFDSVFPSVLKLCAGDIYVIESEYILRAGAKEALEYYLKLKAPECSFIILDKGIKLVRDYPPNSS